MLLQGILGLKYRFVVSILVGWAIVYVIIFYRELCRLDILKANNVFFTRVKSRHKKSVIISLDRTANCSALNPDILLYNRIFKTGSTSMRKWFTSFQHNRQFHLEFATTEQWYDHKKKHVFPGIIARHAKTMLSKAEVKRYIFMAHFYFRSRIKVPYQYIYINQVRDPVRRVISHFFYMHRSKNRPKRRLREMRRNGHLKETFEQCLKLQHEGCERNVMTRFFCGKHSYCKGGSTRALQRAKSNIVRHYASVGLLEHLDVYKQILHKRLPGFVPHNAMQYVFKVKVNPRYNSSEVSENTLNEIRKLNAADIKLYDFIQKRFWRQAKACGIYTNSTISV
ncbi:heparan sulfate 2-O-sulfotransferase 1-like [Exaiptasia diaphana]|uniref:Uncharacterized protein n=1 Tax=Exaiptasia diaphana TaxID=2652724 RepID=A0A913YSY5_EXADI|nr:heparan sulfate 2-O-sulfotransferase 1-like [Exaiptasia diaphana]